MKIDPLYRPHYKSVFDGLCGKLGKAMGFGVTALQNSVTDTNDVRKIAQHLMEIMEKQFHQLTKQLKKEMEQTKQKNEHRQLTVDDHSSESDAYEVDESSKMQLPVNDITLGAGDTQASRQSNSTSNAPTHSEDIFTNMQQS
ncbi:unnamed protein product [Didymodactylos carnosus]|uniref:Uncharacterized protein n=1 Tax=Didymodactylos carnosus TaxID=1234261 RepID=A0A815PY50_9BILA|nr:unnamed protein product [Didymodactylos carnosus]CAF4327894.1 unnamed protein product [Didymodactylos carnosus]